jgi:spermidine dehydrogenase
MVRKNDRELGIDRAITRRDFIYGSSLLMGSALAGCDSGDSRAPVAVQDYGFDVGSDWYGPGGTGDYAASHGNTPGLVRTAHDIRAGRFNDAALRVADSSEEFDLVIIGGGFAGLSAAHHFHRLNPSGRALILDNHPIFGGEAKRNDFEVNGVHISGPQGSNDFAVQRKTGDPDDYFTALNLPREYEFAEPGGAAAGMRIPFDNYDYLHWHHNSFDVGHFFRSGATPWVKDLWRSGLDDAPWSEEERQAFRRLREIDVVAPNGQALDPWLDSMTINSYYEDVLGLPETVASYYDPIMASIIGLGGDAISAHWGRYFSMPGFTRPTDYEAGALMSFPGGNAAIARHFVKNFNPGAIDGSSFEEILFGRIVFDELDRDGKPVRIRLRSTAVNVENQADRVRVIYARDGELHQLTAKAVVMASGGWVNRHVIRDLPDTYHQAYDAFMHSPVLVANVALTNWRFLERLGVSAAIWSEGFGFTCNIRRPMIVGGHAQPLHPDQPTVLTFYAPLFKPGLPAKQQGIAARAELLGTSFADYERQIREQMTEMFDAGGFDPVNDIAGIILNRWGHAYVNPGPGFRFGSDGSPAPPDVIREPIGRIAIGHSELRGHQYWTGAAGEGRRAVEALLDRHF